MQVIFLDNKKGVEIDGYVNAVERLSKPLKTRTGQTFREKISKGAFSRAIERNDDIRVLLNHDWSRNLGGTKDNSLQLSEDNIGLHARFYTEDSEIVEKGRKGELIGWSFGYRDIDVESGEEAEMLTRDVKDLELYEVSILDKSKCPAYDGTLITVRDDSEYYHGEPLMTETLVRDEHTPDPIDYSAYEQAIESMKE